MLLERANMLETLSSTDDVWRHVTRTLNRLGLTCLIYLTVDQDFDGPVLMTNIPQLYDGQDIRKDPFLSHCCRSYAITLTGPAYLPDYAYLPDSAKAFIKTARAVGFETGLGIPMRLRGSERFGGFNVGTALGRPDFEESVLPRAEELRAFCLLAHRRLEELAAEDASQPAPELGRSRLVAPEHAALSDLTPREREVAYLVAQGFSRKVCARLCNLSPNTVSDYIKSVYKKLGINNRAELARLALSAAPDPGAHQRATPV